MIELKIDVHSELHYAFNQMNSEGRISNPISKYVEDFLRSSQDNELILFRGNTETSVLLAVNNKSYINITPYAPMPKKPTSPIQLAIDHIKNAKPAENSVFVSSSILPATCSHISAKNMRSNKYFPIQIMIMDTRDEKNKSYITAAEVLISVQSGGPDIIDSPVFGKFENPTLSFTPEMPSYLWAESQGEVLLPKGAKALSLGELYFTKAENNSRRSVTMTWNWIPSSIVTETIKEKVQESVIYWNDITAKVLAKMKAKCGIDFYDCELDDYGVKGDCIINIEKP